MESGGLTALSREFTSPQQRVVIEFSFAFSSGSGRSLNVWTHEPNGRDASQLNLCIQGGALMQFDGRTRTWEEITRNIHPTLDSVKPVWHRLRAIVDAHESSIDFWVSKPHSRELPDQPITRATYRTNLPIGAIDLVSGKRIASRAWYLLDDLFAVWRRNARHAFSRPGWRSVCSGRANESVEFTRRRDGQLLAL